MKFDEGIVPQVDDENYNPIIDRKRITQINTPI